MVPPWYTVACILYYLGEGLESLNYRPISGASTQISPERPLYVVHGWLRVVSEESVHRHHHARCTEPTLSPVGLGYPLLHAENR